MTSLSVPKLWWRRRRARKELFRKITFLLLSQAVETCISSLLCKIVVSLIFVFPITPIKPCGKLLTSMKLRAKKRKE
jgi:hypothetical protein